MRLRNRVTGVVVNVDDDLGKRLGSDWEPADKPEPKKPSARRAAKKSDDK